MIRLSKQQVERKIEFIGSYVNAANAADASKFDANANVTSKNIATLEAELWKDYNIQINRGIVSAKIAELFGQELADEYNRQIEDHEIYVHDETSLKPYTYGPSESIVVYKDGKKLLTTFELLYAMYTDLPETCLSVDDGAYAKYPLDLFIDDFNNKRTKITRLVRKSRKRDMYRIKTKYGEDLIVTDNHPLIIDSSNVDNTVNAIDSLGCVQFKQDSVFDGNTTEIDIVAEFGYDNYGSYCISPVNDGKKIEGIKPIVELSAELGYFVGFFIAEGSITDGMTIITQNNRDTLARLASYMFTATGISGKIYKDVSASHSDRQVKWKLQYNSEFLIGLIETYFGISRHAERKTIPQNIFNTNRVFVGGLMSGMIDGDGTYGSGRLSIRLASRGAITQLAILLRAFGVGISMTYQEQSDQAFGSYSSNYPVFGVSFGLTGDLDLQLSYKVNEHSDSITDTTRYLCGQSTINSVDKIVNDSYLNTDIYDITTETSTFMCNNILVHNCTSITMYPFLINGLVSLGGESKAPKHLESFCGSFVNLVFAVSSQFAGALATVEFLMYFDYFARKDYGDDYLTTARDKIENHLQHVVYAINQPAAARGYQSVFWNISMFDKFYFDAMFGEFAFPDENFTRPSWDSVSKLQSFFMQWFNGEREKAILTFPVVTVAMLTENGKVKDRSFLDMCAKEMSEGNSFFTYLSDSADSLASCCRLRNEMAENEFSFSLGAGGVSTGSINVITLNMNRLIQEKIDLKSTIDKIHKYQVAYRKVMEQYLDHHMLTVYDAGFISIDKQFLTIGINGMVEGAEALGFTISNNPEYIDFVSSQLKIIYDANKDAYKTYGYKFNTEFVPAENLGVKNAAWDRKRGLKVPRDCYNSYFYVVEDTDTNPVDKIILHGKEMVKYLDGGSALHLNLEEYLSKDAYVKLFDSCALAGCNYFTTNVKITICNECENIDKHTLKACPKCGSRNIDYATRIIGYLKRVGSFSSARQKEESQRYYAID